MPYRPILENSLDWLETSEIKTAGGQSYIATRDRFQARLDQIFQSVVESAIVPPDFALLVATIGEIGNNSFDHNIGRWRDVPGCFLQTAFCNEGFSAAIVDRGQGIRATLSRVDASLSTDQLAVETAFAKRISGRFPEKRGNGLKFVRNAINAHPTRCLLCVSGSGLLKLGGWSERLRTIEEEILKRKMPSWGTFTFMSWGYK